MLPPPAHVVVVKYDAGGVPLQFAARVEEYLKRRVTVRITGYCASACTMVTAVDDRLCVSPDAIMAFHQAFHPNPFDPLDTSIRADDGTALLMKHYPQRLRDWIASKGGLTKDIIVLRGAALLGLFQRCRS